MPDNDGDVTGSAITPRSSGTSWTRRILFVVMLLVVAGAAAFGTKWWLDRRAAQRAEVRAATNQVRTEAVTLHNAMIDTTRNSAEAAASLRLTLQEHLTVSERSDEQLATDRRNQRSALVDAAKQLDRHASAPLPEIPELADAGAVRDDLERLEELQAQAGQLADRLRTDAQRTGQWAAALSELRQAASTYTRTVNDQPSTHDAERLREQWMEERRALVEYRKTIREVEETPGLAPMATAYLDYIRANMEFVDEVIGLLAEEEIDAYNQRVDEVFNAEDTFGFQAAVSTATREALDAGVLSRLAETRQRAVQLFDQLQTARADMSPTTTGTPATPIDSPTATTDSPGSPATPGN